jgi:hypothetical protein
MQGPYNRYKQDDLYAVRLLMTRMLRSQISDGFIIVVITVRTDYSKNEKIMGLPVPAVRLCAVRTETKEPLKKLAIADKFQKHHSFLNVRSCIRADLLLQTINTRTSVKSISNYPTCSTYCTLLCCLTRVDEV